MPLIDPKVKQAVTGATKLAGATKGIGSAVSAMRNKGQQGNLMGNRLGGMRPQMAPQGPGLNVGPSQLPFNPPPSMGVPPIGQNMGDFNPALPNQALPDQTLPNQGLMPPGMLNLGPSQLPFNPQGFNPNFNPGQMPMQPGNPAGRQAMMRNAMMRGRGMNRGINPQTY